MTYQMDFTGERYIPSVKGQIEAEHLHRYYMTLQLVKGKSVLDIASGEGFGSALISKHAKQVIGVDIDSAAIKHANIKYKSNNLEFIQGSCAEIPLPEASVDVVVSFETIEHHDQHEKMLDEIKRVLKPSGCLIISSPNKLEYSDATNYSNPYHIKELYKEQFVSLLNQHFKNVDVFGQRVIYGSSIVADGNPRAFSTFFNEHDNIESSSALTKPQYDIAIASNIELPILDNSIFERNIQESDVVTELIKTLEAYKSRVDDLINESNNTKKWALNLDNELAKFKSLTSNQNLEITGLKKWGQTLSSNLDEKDERIYDLSIQMENLSDELFAKNRWALELDEDYQEKDDQLNRLKEEIIKLTPSESVKKNNLSLLLSKILRKLSSVMQRVKNRLIDSLSKLKHRSLTEAAPEELSSIEADGLEINPALIHLQTSNSPKVSVIIPIYGKLGYTLRCLRSIAMNAPIIEFEVIAVDDHSPDNSFEALSKVKGLRIIANSSNQGFIRSCNHGAQEARGEYLLFLNNDTEVTPNWLDALHRTFVDLPGTGLVGSKLIYPDGRLQEAGGIIWSDGSAWNFGRLQKPDNPIYNYAREVDYCSGASIMVPTRLFNELGKFDERYLPAYGEDSDLALAIRDAGYRVIYQPLSTIIHYEGITSGTDVSEGVKSYQVANAKKLYEKWKHRLIQHQQPGIDPDSAKDRRASKRVLVLDHTTPQPDHDAGSITVFNLLLLLREMDFQITFIPENNLAYIPGYTADLQTNGVEVLYYPFISSVPSHLKKQGERYDLAFIFRPTVMKRYFDDIKKYCPNAKVLYHTVDLHYLRMEREATLESSHIKQKYADRMKALEIKSILSADTSIVHSTVELELLNREIPEASLAVFPLILDVPDFQPDFFSRQGIVFIGGYQHTPNIDAVKYFVTEIMPILRKRLPGVIFYAVGSQAPAEITRLACEDVVITGFVEKLNPFLEKMRISVAPLRFGAGIKGKIGSAMAVGLPTVASEIAVEGMKLTNDANILVANSPDQFIDKIITVYNQQDVWETISQNSLKFAREYWSDEASWNTLADILKTLGISPSRGKLPLSLYNEHNKRNKDQPIIKPIASVATKQELGKVLTGSLLANSNDYEKVLIEQHPFAEPFSFLGYCAPCKQEVDFLVDMVSGGQKSEGSWLPNWRERIECPLCCMNNRQRLIATLIDQEFHNQTNKSVYFMEQVTPIFTWVMNTFENHQIVGSEYLGHEFEGGSIHKGLRHEDVENLSFANNSLDLIVSNDVFEHVPEPLKAFSECSRTLKMGGVMLASIPFHSSEENTVIRAQLTNGELQHFLTPAYHGNPVSEEGSLVFNDFGWDIIPAIKKAGFSDVSVDIYTSIKHGHLGGGQLIFKAVK